MVKDITIGIRKLESRKTDLIDLEEARSYWVLVLIYSKILEQTF